jgi:DNA-binding CsgD family transcriptional regulator/Tfp pilus assembly protein PilF
VRTATGHLALVYIAQGNHVRAQEVLDAALDADTPMRTIGQRLTWRARIVLAQAHGNASAALELADAMIAAAPNHETGPAIIRLERLRGEALCALRRPPEAEGALLAALDSATTYGARSSAWRIQLALVKVYQAQRRPADAARACDSARAILAECAANIADRALRERFEAATAALLPRPPGMSPRKEARAAFDGLTEREREVAALITRGQSNHAIAELLVVSERTVETHVSSILLKLNFSSRAQIAAWAVGKGLAPSGEKR